MGEPVSPKKFKNVPEIDFNGRCSSVSPEWASVRIVPEEEMTEHNLLAVRVIVTSDGSSSELEPEFYGGSSVSEFNKGLPPLSESKGYILPSRRPLSLNTNLVKGEEGCEKSKAANALQRACSLRDSSTSRKHHNWKKKIQSNFPLLYSKKNGPSSKDSSASIRWETDPLQTEVYVKQVQNVIHCVQQFPHHLPEYIDITPCICFDSTGRHGEQMQMDCGRMFKLTSSNKIPEIPSGHFKPHSPAFQNKGKATDVPGEIPSYIPHYSFHNHAQPLARSKSTHHGIVASTPIYTKHGDEEDSIEGQYLKKQTVNSEQRTSGLFIKNSDTSSVNPDEGDKTPSTSAKERHDRHFNKAKNKIMRKLTLSMEQQSKLLSLNDAKLDGIRTEQQGQEIPEQKNAKKLTCRSLKFSENHLPILSPKYSIPKNVDNCPKEHIAGQPKSPLRLIASAIKRSIIEPLIFPPEGLKKGQDTHARLPSESTFFSFPHTSVNLRNSKNHEEYDDLQMQESSVLDSAEEGLQTQSSEMSNFPSSPKEEYDLGTSFPVYSVHASPSKSPYNCKYTSSTCMDDVPTLLEQFTLKENLWKSTRDDLSSHNQKNNFYSSLRLRNKSADTVLDSPVQRNNIQNLFSNVKSEVDDRDKNSSLLPVPSCTIFDVDEVLNNTRREEYVGSEHLPVRNQVTDYCSSSDSELEHKPSLPRKTKKTFKRNRKLEKETKQLVKQEELKRLHKAQAIQRLLEEVEEKQRNLEVYGVQIERELRGESDSSTQDETRLLHEWFELVLEKNKLMRYESELLIIAKELELEDHQS